MCNKILNFFKSLKRAYDSYINKYILCDVYLCPGMMVYLDNSTESYSGWWMIVSDSKLKLHAVHLSPELSTRTLDFFINHIAYENVLEIYNSIEDCALGQGYALYSKNND